MKKDLTEIVFILDKSGSMGGFESDTIGGFNSTLSKQKEIPGEAVVTSVLFDDKMTIVHNRVDIKDMKPLTSEQYVPYGSTALLDAVGTTIKRITDLHSEMGDSAPAKTMFIIITDGYENSSRSYRYSQIKRMIECQEECGWKFLFLGANIDVAKEAENLGIPKESAVRFEQNVDGFIACYDEVCASLGSYRRD